MVQAIPEVCPYFKRGICSIKHRRVATFIDTRMWGGNGEGAVLRWCQQADFAGEGYLHCPIFSKYFWAVLQEKAASGIANVVKETLQ